MTEHLQSEEVNDEAKLALELLNYTNEHLFLTGKAGTGKTTFLKNFLSRTRKKAAVVAPTGVAAINAGGMTIHSLFQFPPGLFIPAKSGAFGQENVFNQSNLARSIYLSKTKKKLLNSIDILVIDEVSMLRADLLDAIDTMLRSVRRNYHEPMGGLQVLYIGDLWQLPPVVKDEDWAILSGYYAAPFFFNSKVVQERKPIIVELKKIYRQDDANFIHLLDNIRNNNLSKDDFYELNKLYQPDQFDFDRDHYVILTTHNFKAKQINQGKMQQLESELHSFNSKISGEFAENSYPTSTELHLKIGAQVMFLKNDIEEKKRYYNGKIAVVSNIRLDKEGKKEIWVMFDDGTEIELLPETWNNLRFEYDDEEDKVNEKVLGTFTQYPVKLAWAVTIHKSQGLTFDEVVIDAGKAFSPGQVYVALSRCRTLKGISLLSEITEDSILVDERVKQFMGNSQSTADLEKILASKRTAFEQGEILKIFELRHLNDIRYSIHSIYKDRKPNPKLKLNEFADKVSKEVADLHVTALKFRKQLTQLFKDGHEDSKIEERVKKACQYFTNEIVQKIWEPFVQIDIILFHSKRVKSIQIRVQEFETYIKKQLNVLQFIEYEGRILYENSDLEINNLRAKIAQQSEQLNLDKAQAINMTSHEITTQQIKEGRSIEEIAELRNLNVSTIYSHAAKSIKEKELSIVQIVDPTLLNEFKQIVTQADKIPSVKMLKEAFDNKYSYGLCQCLLNSLDA